MDIKRYENPPLSEKTVKGMSLNIDDLAAIGRLLSLQDNVYDEMFEKVLQSLADQAIEIKALRTEVGELRKEVDALSVQVSKLTITVDKTEREVDVLIKDVEKLKRANTIIAHAIRIGIGIIVGLGIVRLLYGPF